MVMHWGKGCGERGKALKRVGERDKCATQTRTDTHRRPRTHTRTLSLSPFASLLLLRQGPRVCSHGCWRQLLLPQHKRKQMPARQVPLPSKNRHTHTQTHTDTDRHTQTHTHTDTHTQTHTHTHTYTQRFLGRASVSACVHLHTRFHFLTLPITTTTTILLESRLSIAWNTDSIKFAVWNDGSGNPMVGGFGSFHLTPDHMTVSYHAANGTVLFTTPEMKPRTFA